MKKIAKPHVSRPPRLPRSGGHTEGGELRPSKRGIALSVKHLPQLAEAVAKALTIARERELIAANHERPIRTREFRMWLSGRFFQETGKAASARLSPRSKAVACRPRKQS